MRRLRGLFLVLSAKRADLRRYSVRAWSPAGIRHFLLDHECSNFTYDIANANELPQFVASATRRPLDEIDGYFEEILGDDSLRNELAQRMRQRRDRNDTPRFGRRLGWYCVVRACRPGLIVETGTHDGLGTSLLLRAAERNAAEGSPTRVITLDIDPASGWLIPEHLRELLEVHTGDTRETLPRALEGREVGMIIHDSEHTAERERFEFGVALEHAAPSLVLISDNAHATTALSDLARELGVEYHYFSERPVRHFHPGAAIGLAIYNRPQLASGNERQ
jgi:predicted O-methyltransferase YrrM